jgi:hypothetical protein
MTHNNKNSDFRQPLRSLIEACNHVNDVYSSSDEDIKDDLQQYNTIQASKKNNMIS